MKRSKVILALVLAVILAITCISVPTFSWFTRSYSESGEKIMLNTKNTYTAYNGKSVTISTISSDTGAPGSYVDANADNACSGAAIASGNRKYFCTTITNGSDLEQNVSLYARKLSIPTRNDNGTLALGVNGPTRSYQDYTDWMTPWMKTTQDAMRIYFEKDDRIAGWNGTEFYICWNDGCESLHATGSNGTYYKLTHVGTDNYPNQYYADIPKTAKYAFFAVENWDTNDKGSPNWEQRSQVIHLEVDGQTQTSSKLYKITSDTSDISDENVVYTVHTLEKTNVMGTCINSYYASIFVAMGDTFNASLSSDEYIGALEYDTSDSNVFTVDKHTGIITPQGEGKAKLYTHSAGGTFPDKQQVQTNVTITVAGQYTFHDVPIVKNMKIAAGDSVEVHWYVINNSADHTLEYSIDHVYVSL